jgi:hypothetical protein
MKYLFFLKILRNVPLAYNFRLYTYGPFDGDVLEHLGYAESLGAVASRAIAYSGGRSYEYRSGPDADLVRQQGQEFLARQEANIAWVLERFGNRSAVDLEMASTIVYIDRSLAERNLTTTIEELARKVRDVKPHLQLDQIEQEARALAESRLLTAVV